MVGEIETGTAVYFDENIISVTAFEKTITNSGDHISTGVLSGEYTVILKDGYIIDAITDNGALTIRNITDNTFYAEYSSGMMYAVITITSKLATPRKSIDLTTLPGWESLSSGSHSITIVAKADGYRDSEPSAAAAMPVKGNLISIDGKQYRVLKTDGNVAEVLCMYDASNSLVFDTNSSYNKTYKNKNIDTYCNNTFYSTLSSAIQSAIVDKTFTQDSWLWNGDSSVIANYNGKYSSSTYVLSLRNETYGSSITRHCYCLSVQDVLDYLEVTTSMTTDNTTLTDVNIWQMFWNQSTSISQYIWLRSAFAELSYMAFRVNGYNGYLDGGDVTISIAVRPAFQIDLSKVDWTKQ